MPRFDIQQQQTVIGTPQASPSAFGGGAGTAALGQAFGQLSQVMIQAKRASDAQKLSNAQAQASTRLQELSFELENDPDFSTHEEKYKQGVDLIQKEIGDGLKDKRLQGLFKQDLQPIIQKQGFEVQRGMIDKQRDQTRADLTNTTQSLSTLAARAADETERDYYLTQGRVAIRTQLQAGILSAVEAEKLDQDFTDSIALADVRELIRTDADAAVDELLNPSGEFSGLDENRRQIWIERAISAQQSNVKAELANEARFQRELDQEQALIEEQTAKDGDAMLAQGKLTSDWVLQNEEDLSKQDFRYFLKQLSGDAGGGRTTPVVFADLYERSGAGEDVRQEARQFLVEGRLSQTDYTKIVNRVEGEQIEGQIPSWFKRGEQFINTSLKPSDVNSDPFKNVRHAEALNEWRVWAENHPNATFEDGEKEFKRIVNGSLLGNLENILAGKNQPRFFSGNRTKMTLQDVANSAEATKAAFQNGSIDESIFKREMMKLLEFKRAIEASQNAQGGVQ